jgi:NADH-quinone oxidoreductase subunit M
VNLPLIVLLAPALTVVAILLVPEARVRWIRGLAAAGTGVALVAALALFAGFSAAPTPDHLPADAWRSGDHVYKHVFQRDWIPALGLQFKLGVDGIGTALVLLTAFTIFTGVFVSFRIRQRVKEYYVSLLALVTGVFGVFTSLDLFWYYFFYEIAVIPMFLLIGIWGSTTRTVDQRYATFKLVLLLSTGAVAALVGLIAVYARAGTFDMVRLEGVDFSHGFQMAWFPVIFLGFGSLVPMWPLHSWSPAGHAAAPAAVSMLHAGVLMKLGAYGVLRVCCTYFPDAAAVYLPWVGLLCCMNIVYGGLVAVWQRDMKLIIGYSSSSHMGYVLLGIASMTAVGIEGAVFLMVAHGLMTALAFGLIGWFYDQTHTRMLDDLGGLMKAMPFVGTCFVIAAMASAGLPGFANFVSEMLVIVGAWESTTMLSKVPAILAVWGLVITGVYLLRAVKDIWFGEMRPRWQGLVDARRVEERLPYVVLVGALLYFGFHPQPMLDVISQGTAPLVRRLDAANAAAAPHGSAPEGAAPKRAATGAPAPASPGGSAR